MKTQEKKKWTVNLEYHSKITHRDIEAETQEEAIKIAEEWTDGNQIACNAESYSADGREQRK